MNNILLITRNMPYVTPSLKTLSSLQFAVLRRLQTFNFMRPASSPRPDVSWETLQPQRSDFDYRPRRKHCRGPSHHQDLLPRHASSHGRGEWRDPALHKRIWTPSSEAATPLIANRCRHLRRWRRGWERMNQSLGSRLSSLTAAPALGSRLPPRADASSLCVSCACVTCYKVLQGKTPSYSASSGHSWSGCVYKVPRTTGHLVNHICLVTCHLC